MPRGPDPMTKALVEAVAANPDGELYAIAKKVALRAMAETYRVLVHGDPQSRVAIAKALGPTFVRMLTEDTADPNAEMRAEFDAMREEMRTGTTTTAAQDYEPPDDQRSRKAKAASADADDDPPGIDHLRKLMGKDGAA